MMRASQNSVVSKDAAAVDEMLCNVALSLNLKQYRSAFADFVTESSSSLPAARRKCRWIG